MCVVVKNDIIRTTLQGPKIYMHNSLGCTKECFFKLFKENIAYNIYLKSINAKNLQSFDNNTHFSIVENFRR